MKKIAWGVLGCARIAERALIPAIREAANAELVGIAARDERRAMFGAAENAFGNALLIDAASRSLRFHQPEHLA